MGLNHNHHTHSQYIHPGKLTTQLKRKIIFQTFSFGVVSKKIRLSPQDPCQPAWMERTWPPNPSLGSLGNVPPRFKIWKLFGLNSQLWNLPSWSPEMTSNNLLFVLATSPFIHIPFIYKCSCSFRLMCDVNHKIIPRVGWSLHNCLTKYHHHHSHHQRILISLLSNGKKTWSRNKYMQHHHKIHILLHMYIYIYPSISPTMCPCMLEKKADTYIKSTVSVFFT